jgi:hypothetical protein
MKEPISPGMLFKNEWDQDFPKYYMYIETKSITKPITSYKSSDRVFYEHWYLKSNGELDLLVDIHEQFFVENYNWLERVDT